MTFGNWAGTLPGVTSLGMIWGIMALGVFITFKILDIADLTVDGSICTGAAVCTMLTVSGANIWLAMFAAFAAGLLCGLVTGIFHTFLGIPAILSGILTQLMLWSVNLLILGRANVALPWRRYHTPISNLPQNIVATNLILAALVVALIIFLYWFFGTELGASLRATGNNPNMSRAQGINTNFAKVLGLMISNGIVAFSGALLAQNNGAADINMGRGAIVVGLAAVIIGEAIVSKISKNFLVRFFGVILGGIIYYLVYQTVIFLGLDTNLMKLLSALVVVIFLGVPYLKKKYFFKRRRDAKGGSENA